MIDRVLEDDGITGDQYGSFAPDHIKEERQRIKQERVRLLSTPCYVVQYVCNCFHDHCVLPILAIPYINAFLAICRLMPRPEGKLRRRSWHSKQTRRKLKHALRSLQLVRKPSEQYSKHYQGQTLMIARQIPILTLRQITSRHHLQIPSRFIPCGGLTCDQTNHNLSSTLLSSASCLFLPICKFATMNYD